MSAEKHTLTLKVNRKALRAIVRTTNALADFERARRELRRSLRLLAETLECSEEVVHRLLGLPAVLVGSGTHLLDNDRQPLAALWARLLERQLFHVGSSSRRGRFLPRAKRGEEPAPIVAAHRQSNRGQLARKNRRSSRRKERRR